MEFKDLDSFIYWLKNEKVEKVSAFMDDCGIILGSAESYMDSSFTIIKKQLETFNRVKLFDSENRRRVVLLTKENDVYYAAFINEKRNFNTSAETVEWSLSKLSDSPLVEWE